MVKYFVSVLLVCAASSSGCVSVDEPGEPEVAEARLPIGGNNSLGWDALSTQDVVSQYWTHYYGARILKDPLRTSLVNNPLNNLPAAVKDAIVNDGWSQELFKYIVYCAVPQWVQSDPNNNLIHINNLSPFQGKYGLHPGWETGSCGATCQEKMSACLLAHANIDDVDESIGIVADWGPVEAASVYNAYTKPEAAYFGNIFLSTQKRYACYNGPYSSTMGLLRVCDSCASGDCTCRDRTQDSRIVLQGSDTNHRIDGCNVTCSTAAYKISGNNNSRYYDDCTVDGVTYTHVVTVRQP